MRLLCNFDLLFAHRDVVQRAFMRLVFSHKNWVQRAFFRLLVTWTVILFPIGTGYKGYS